MEGGRWGGKKERKRETETRRGGRMLKGRRDEKGKETGKEEVLPWIKYITVHQLLPPPPPMLLSCLQSVQVQNQLLLISVLNTTCLPSEPRCPGMRSAW